MTNSLPPVADAKCLTSALRAAGIDGNAIVRDVTAIAAPIKKLRSHTYRLQLDYEGSTEALPRTLILKTGHLNEIGRPDYSNAIEVAFYRDIAPSFPPDLVPRCYQAAEVTENTTWHLLLEDLADTHFVATQWPLPPTIEQCEEIVRTLARIHAEWWDHPRLGTTLGQWRDETGWNDSLRKFATTLEHFTARFADILPTERRELYKRLLDRSPKLLKRYHSRRHLTIVHGDAHFWNFFLPRPGTAGSPRLLDWENWSINTATTDLAYTIAMLWYPDRRRRFEQHLLSCYHATLLAHGIEGYDRSSLDEDYRLSALWLIMRPIAQAMAGIGGGVW